MNTSNLWINTGIPLHPGALEQYFLAPHTQRYQHLELTQLNYIKNVGETL